MANVYDEEQYYIAALVVSVVIIVFGIIRCAYLQDMGEEIDLERYMRVVDWAERNEELKPKLVEYLKDNIITKGEFYDMKNLVETKEKAVAIKALEKYR